MNLFDVVSVLEKLTIEDIREVAKDLISDQRMTVLRYFLNNIKGAAMWGNVLPLLLEPAEESAGNRYKACRGELLTLFTL